MLLYATVNDLTSSPNPWLDTDPPNPALLLQYATVMVAKACQFSLYGDPPVEPAADVLRDATCAQVASWVALGVDPAKAGTDMPGPVKSSTLLSGTVVRDTTAAVQQSVEAVKGLCDIAAALLQTAGLLWLPLPLGAPDDDRLPEWGQGRPWKLFADALSGETQWPFYLWDYQ